MMAKRVSDIWLNFSEERERKVKCLLCGKQLSVANKSTFNLIRHMQKLHPTQAIARQSTIDVFEGSSCATSNLNFRPNTEKSSNSKINSYFNKPLSLKKKEEIDKQILKMIVKEYHPFTIVEEQEFKKLLQLLNPNYALPTRKTLSSTLLTTAYCATVDVVKERLKRALAVCLTVDGWTSRTQDNYFCITAHYIVEGDKKTFLASDLLSCESYTERHTAVNLTKLLQNVLKEWKIENQVEVIVTDNAANMKAAVRGGGWRHWGCFAHTLNLIAQSGLREISVLLKKIKAIVRLFTKSNYATMELKRAMERMQISPLKIINDVPTRWNSTNDMLKRFFVLKTPLISSLALIKSSARVADEVLYSNVDILENEEWVVIEQTIKVMEMFQKVTKLMSTQKHVGASSLIFCVKQLSKHLNSMQTIELVPVVRKLVSNLQSGITDRFIDLENNIFISEATVLDPRFKKLGFINESKYKATVDRLYNEVANTKIFTDQDIVDEQSEATDGAVNIENESLDEMWEEFDAEAEQYLRPGNQMASAIVELDKYLAEPILPRKDKNGKNQCPLMWWNQRKHIYPRLYEIVKTRLCISGTSVPCERVFSHAGQIISEKRENIKVSKLSQMVFLNYNIDNKDF